MSIKNRQRLEFAAAGFLNEMRKQWVKMHPDDPCPVKNLSEYPATERSALMAGIEKAIQYAGPDADIAFVAWSEKRAEEMSRTT